MKLQKLTAVIVASMAAGSIATAASITIDNLEPRAAGPLAADVTVGSGTFGTSHGNAPWTVSLTVANQNLDGDGNFDDGFTFDLTASTTATGGVSIWGQGANNSNGAGTNTSFSGIDGLSFSVSNVVGTTTVGDAIVFDGFSGATAASGGGAAVDRTVDAGGVTFTMSSPDMGSFQFIQDAETFGSLFSTLTFSNQGGTAGSLVVRQLDLQFSSTPIPEPSSVALLGLAGGLLLRRRRK